MKKIYTSIDIGSDSIKMVTAEIYKGKINILASTAIKSVLKINYKLYILTKNDKAPKEVLFFSSTLTPGNVISDLDEWATQEILRFVIHGGLRDYE